MAASNQHYPTNEIYNLTNIDRDFLRNVLETGLNNDFDNVNVQWVTCPNLDHLFNFVAKGLCGNPVFIEVGNKETQHIKNPGKNSKYNIEEILKLPKLSEYRHNFNSFVFGKSIIRSNENLYELVMNGSISSEPRGPKGIGTLENRSSIIRIDSQPNKCDVENVTNFDFESHGTFFCSDGVEGPVLKINAKEKNEWRQLPTFSGFIDSMQNSLIRAFGPNPIVLGGVYAPSTHWCHTLQPHPWENEKLAESPGKYGRLPLYENNRNKCIVIRPDSIITMFSNIADRVQDDNNSPIKVTNKIVQCLNHHSRGHFFPTNDSLRTYEGYFCPAEKFFRVN